MHSIAATHVATMMYSAESLQLDCSGTGHGGCDINRTPYGSSFGGISAGQCAGAEEVWLCRLHGVCKHVGYRQQLPCDSLSAGLFITQQCRVRAGSLEMTRVLIATSQSAFRGLLQFYGV